MNSTLCFSASVQGHSHVLHNLECQDASGSVSYPRWGCHVFVTADGHGDPSCTRSARGSAIAVDVTLDVLKDLVRDHKGNIEWILDTPEGNDLAREAGSRIVRRWRSRVLEELQENPITQVELNAMSDSARQSLEVNPERLYGTTLVAGALMPQALLLYQQGDGFCVVMNKVGALIHPIPEDPRCQGNRTTSLCNNDAEQSIRSALIDLRGTDALACFMGSDGVSGTFLGDEGLDNFCVCLALELIEMKSRSDVEQALNTMLPTISEQGTGDDASIAGFVNIELVRGITAYLNQRNEEYRLSSELNAVEDKLVSMERLHNYYATQSPRDADDAHKRELFLAEYDSLQTHATELHTQIDQEKTNQIAKQPLPPMQREEPVEEKSSKEESSLVEPRPATTEKPTSVANAEPKRATPSKRTIQANVSTRKRQKSNHLFIALGIVFAVTLVGAGVLIDRTLFYPSDNIETTQGSTDKEQDQPDEQALDVQNLTNSEQAAQSKSWEMFSELEVSLPHVMKGDEQKLYETMFGDAFVLSNTPSNTDGNTTTHTLYYRSAAEAYNDLVYTSGDPQYYANPNSPFSVDDLIDALRKQEIWRSYEWTSKDAEPKISKNLMKEILSDSSFSAYCKDLNLADETGGSSSQQDRTRDNQGQATSSTTESEGSARNNKVQETHDQTSGNLSFE